MKLHFDAFKSFNFHCFNHWKCLTRWGDSFSSELLCWSWRTRRKVDKSNSNAIKDKKRALRISRECEKLCRVAACFHPTYTTTMTMTSDQIGFAISKQTRWRDGKSFLLSSSTSCNVCATLMRLSIYLRSEKKSWELLLHERVKVFRDI